MSDENFFEELVQDIDGKLEVEQKFLDELEKQVREVRDRTSKLRQAKRALLGEKAQPAKSKPARGYTGAHNPNWKPNDQSVQAILTSLAEADEPLTLKEIEDRAGWSHSHVDSTVRYLRKHEMVRLAGKRGTANVYTPMPNGSTGLKETEHAANAV